MSTCERDECQQLGVTYWVSGRDVQWIAGTAMVTGKSSGLQPSGSIRLCSTHALATFGVSAGEDGAA